MNRLFATLIALTLAAPLAGALSLPGAPVDLTESYLVGFHEYPRDIQVGDAYEGGRVVHVDPILHFITVETQTPAVFVARTELDARVRYVEPNGVWSISYTPNDPRWGEQYGPKNIGAPVAWDTTLGSTTVKVCIVDTGLRATHEDIAGRVAGQWDFVSNDGTAQDGNGHGTHVATTALGITGNGKGIAGMSQSSVLVARVLDNAGSGSYDWIASGIRWCADNGAAVISMSLGGSSTTTALGDAVAYAASKGSLQIAASGNSGPCSNCVSYPAKYAEVMAVACTTSTRAKCSFSSSGPEVAISAPGNGIVAGWHTSDTAYNTISGTSMSTPHVSGVAALVKTVNPGFTKEDLRNRLQSTARDLGAAGKDNDFGHGEVDAASAVAGGTTPPPPTGETRVYFEDMDDGAQGWSKSTTSDLWHTTSACKAPLGARHLAWTQDSTCTYSTGARVTNWAQSGAIGVSGKTQGTLKLKHQFDIEQYSGGAYDILRVQVSRDGSSWTTLQQWDSRNADVTSWTQLSYDIDSFMGGSLYVRFWTDTVDGTANNYPGWFIEDVEVTAS